jgi:hypothetical protein
MASVSDIVVLVHPSDESTGVPLNNTIQILFNTELDEWSLENGGFILEGPDTDLVVYPGYTPTTLIQGEEKEILQSPGLKGIVPGTFSFERISPTNLITVSGIDTLGTRSQYRTRLIFKSLNQLAPLTEYTIYLAGDDDLLDAEIYSIRNRSVFDSVTDGGNSGNGSITSFGTYTGALSSDVFNIRITEAGVVGEAQYEWWLDSIPLTLNGPSLVTSSVVGLGLGAEVQFAEGQYEVGDVFTFVVKKPSLYTDTVTATFTTGNGSITVVPTSTATSPTGTPQLGPIAADFEILKVFPPDKSTNLEPKALNRITVCFTDEIDASTVTPNAVTVGVAPVSDHPALSSIVKPGLISKTLTVSGNALLIDLVPSDFVSNELNDCFPNYTLFTINSFETLVAQLEIGEETIEPEFIAFYNLNPLSVKLSDSFTGSIKDVTSTPLAFNSDQTFSKNVPNQSVVFNLLANDGCIVASRSVTMSWLPRVYIGVNTGVGAGNGTDTLVLGLAQQPLQATRAGTYEVSPGLGQKIFYAAPSSYGTPTFQIGSFPGGFFLVGTVAVTNGFGVTINYDIYESSNASLGPVTLQVI